MRWNQVRPAHPKSGPPSSTRVAASRLPCLKSALGDNLGPDCLLGAAGSYSVVPDRRAFSVTCKKPLLLAPGSAQLQTKGTFACLAARVVFFSEERVEGKVPETLPEPLCSQECGLLYVQPWEPRDWGGGGGGGMLLQTHRHDSESSFCCFP